MTLLLLFPTGMRSRQQNPFALKRSASLPLRGFSLGDRETCIHPHEVGGAGAFVRASGGGGGCKADKRYQGESSTRGRRLEYAPLYWNSAHRVVIIALPVPRSDKLYGNTDQLMFLVASPPPPAAAASSML
jgi:hypothetical protein